jgi:hypothetical protein
MTSFDLKLNTTDIYIRESQMIYFFDCVYSFFEFIFLGRKIGQIFTTQKNSCLKRL